MDATPEVIRAIMLEGSLHLLHGLCCMTCAAPERRHWRVSTGAGRLGGVRVGQTPGLSNTKEMASRSIRTGLQQLFGKRTRSDDDKEEEEEEEEEEEKN